MPSLTEQPITSLKGVGEKRARLFTKLGVGSVGALLRFYPRAYENFADAVPLEEAPFGEPCCLRARLLGAPVEHRVRPGMTLYRCVAGHGGITLKITLFNNKYLAARLKAGEEYIFRGKMEGNFYARQMSSPEIVPADAAYIRPVYRQTEGLASYVVEAAVRDALGRLDRSPDALPDPLPESLRAAHDLLPLPQALRAVHFPRSAAELERARTRLIFEELLTLQLGLMRMKGRSRAETGRSLTRDCTEEFFRLLPFTPTGAQRRAVAECMADLRGPVPMNRLIQGDVGSGKTAVAAALCHSAVQNGFQCALMAPTEILAEQHARSLAAMLGPAGVRTALLTGSGSAREKVEVRERLRSGEVDLIVGTHALIQESVTFRRLGLVVTDEQHRFGVAQRAALAQKGESPHLLVMSATPIPRTLALMIYGDLDVSVLDELPPGRSPVKTYAVSGALRTRAYGYVKKHLDEGRQGYVVCPLVEEGDSELAAAEQYAARLQNGAFRGYRVGLLHGRMRPAEKEDVMRRFLSGEIQLLVSTTVIEVGVDVPNAVIMLIENAERFGLSQLHQLRGRVGRGRHQSTCILVSDAQNEEAVRRLKIMASQTDGFKIAEEDLRLRGPGDFFGSRQHGLPELKIADIVTDLDVLRQTQRCARALLDGDPELGRPEHRALRDAVDELFRTAQDGALN